LLTQFRGGAGDMACADVATAKAKVTKAINLIISSLLVNLWEDIRTEDYDAPQRRNLRFDS
jgi:hypothetical protein